MNNRRIQLIRPGSIRPSQLFDSIFNEVFDSTLLDDSNGGLNTIITDNIAIDMYETDKHVIIEAKVPGFKAEDLNIKVEDNMLTIEGTRTEHNEDREGRRYHVKEMRSQAIYRSVMLPVKVNADLAEADFKDGIVKISFPKSEESKTKVIKINGRS